MALAPLTRPISATRRFLDFLVGRGLLKAGFVSILADKDLLELKKYFLEKKILGSGKFDRLLAEFFGLPYQRLIDRPIRPEVVKLFSEDIIRKYQAVPVKLEGTDLELAIGEPASLEQRAPEVIRLLRRQKGLSIRLVVVPKADIEAVLSRLKPPPPDHPTQPSLSKQDLLRQVEPTKRIDLAEMKIEERFLKKIPYAVAKKYQLIVFDQVEPKSQFEPPLVKVAYVNENDIHIREILTYIEQKNKVLVDRYVTDADSIKLALLQYPQVERDKIDAQLKDSAIKKEDDITIEETEATPPPAPKAPAETQPKPAAAAPATESQKAAEAEDRILAPPSGGNVLVLSQDDITARPVSESAPELQRLAKEQQLSVEDQNLDRLLHAPVVSVEDLARSFKSGVIPEIVAACLFLAIRMQASDIHIEASQQKVRIRYRIDGILHDIIHVPKFLHAPLVSRIKILAKMKIDEQRVPQDGRFDVIIDKRQVDLRVSTLPTVHGEKVVMRLLDKSVGVISLEQLGLTGSAFDRVITNIEKPYGIVLATGPTGSGKSTSLYASLTRISRPGVNIITLEDPVEYELAGINQAQVKPGIGFTFAEGLRSVLRQDPNVIMVGEIRDLETAAMATHAALTGHLVLSTLHTNDSAGALPRLINMGVEPFLITSSINAVIGQRLVRKICDHCKEPIPIPPMLKEYVVSELSAMPSQSGQLKTLDFNQLTFYRGRGCLECTNGYKGRIGIFEVLTMSERIEDLAVSRAPSSEIKKAAIEEGLITMTQDGLMKALKSITTLDEVLRVTTTEIKEIPDTAA